MTNSPAPRRVQKGLIGEPLADKAIQGRDGRHRQCADEKGQRGPRHTAAESAHLVQIAGPVL